MNGGIADITTEQLDSIVKYDEAQLGEVKAIEILPSKMSNTVSAFANSDGGDLWIGVDETRVKKHRSWRGFKRIEDANAHIEVLDKVMQLSQGYSFEFLRHQSSVGFVLHIEVAKVSRIIYATNGQAYVRRSGHNQPAISHIMLQQLERNKGIVSFETTNVNADPNTIINSIVTRTFMRNLMPYTNSDEWLNKQQVIVDGKPTVAGVILFADEPQNILPKRSGIKIARYTTSDAGEGTRDTLSYNPISIEGCAYNLIQSALRKTQGIIEGVFKWTELGAEMVSYPPETLP